MKSARRTGSVAVIACLLLSIIAPAANAREAEPTAALADTVSTLLAYVRESGCVFIRNGREHDAAAAAKHMERKYRHYMNDIETPEDFIRLAATKSMMSGKPYRVRTSSGEERLSADWLADVLDSMRRPASPSAREPRGSTGVVPSDASSVPADSAVDASPDTSIVPADTVRAGHDAPADTASAAI